jgi:hypothetical protein
MFAGRRDRSLVLAADVWKSEDGTGRTGTEGKRDRSSMFAAYVYQASQSVLLHPRRDVDSEEPDSAVAKYRRSEAPRRR